MRLRRRRRPGAQVVRVHLDEPLDDALADASDKLYVVASLGGEVVGHAWIAGGRLTPGALGARIAESSHGTARAAALRLRLRERLDGLPAPDGPAPPRVSVVVCTRDRPDALERCLRSLQALDPAAHELIVVDNAPTIDAARPICDRFGVTYLLEPVPGASRARNRGIAASSGELIAFTDDDCIPDPGWLGRGSRAFADPLVAAVAGYIGPWQLGTRSQVRFERHGGFERHYRRRTLDALTGSPALAAAAVGASANVIVRRSAFDVAGPFAEDMGPGTPVRGAEDKELFFRLLRAGLRIVHDPAQVVWHDHRRTDAELRALLHDYALGEVAWHTRLLVRERELPVVKLTRWWARHVAADVYRWLRRRPSAVPLSMTAGEVSGMLAGPWAYRASQRARREPLPVPAARAPAGARVRVATAEAPGLTVAVASHDRRDSLRETLVALAAQNYPSDRWEIALVLDGSTDGSAEMARALELPCALRVWEQPTGGVASARNRGAQAASHPIVVFLDDDIRPERGFLAAHAAAHRDAPADHFGLGHYPPAFERRDFNAQLVRAWWTDHFRRLAEPSHQWRFTDVCDGNSSVPVGLFRELGGFDEEFGAGRRRQDWEFGIRLLRRGVPLAFHPDTTAWHHFDPATATALRNGRQEGRDDVLLADKHPEAAAALPLKWMADGRVERFLVAGRVTPALSGSAPWRRAALAALDTLEATGLRGRWGRLMQRLYAIAYASGVAEVLPDREVREAALDSRRWATQEVVLDLDAPPSPPTVDGVLLPEVSVRHRGRTLGTVDGVTGARQWDLEDLLDRLVDELGWHPWLPSLLDLLE